MSQIVTRTTRRSVALAAALLLPIVALAAASALRAATPEPPRPALPGKFVWHDLLTTDSPAVEKFYAGLFGWTFEVQKGRENPYKVIRLAGVPVGGIVDVSAKKSEVPSSTWLSYVSVADVDKAVAAFPEPQRQGPARARSRRLRRDSGRGRRPAGRHPGPREDHEGRPAGCGRRSRGVLPLDGIRGGRRPGRHRLLQGRPGIHRGADRRRGPRGVLRAQGGRQAARRALPDSVEGSSFQLAPVRPRGGRRGGGEEGRSPSEAGFSWPRSPR